MFCFIVGCDPGNPEAQRQFMRMLEDASEYDGLEEILVNDTQPWKALLCFETQEQAQTAQWMLDMGGAERREGNGQDADAGGSGGDPGIQGQGYGAEDHAGNGSHGTPAAGDGNSAGRMDQ